MTDKQMFAGRSQSRVAISWLHHTSDTLRIQTIHDAFMRDKRNIAEDMDFQANRFMNFCRDAMNRVPTAAWCFNTSAWVMRWL